jgi:hypothetical protein
LFFVAPGGIFDLASFNFQVPMFISAARQRARPAQNIARETRIVLTFMFPPVSVPLSTAIWCGTFYPDRHPE